MPDASFSSELHQLSDVLPNMAGRLADDRDAPAPRLLADLAHELRTPLATLEAYIDGLEDDVVPADAGLVGDDARPGRPAAPAGRRPA